MAASYLGHLSAEDHLKVMRHPVQEMNVQVIESLIRRLRTCRTFADYDDFQRALFQYLYPREQHRGECRRCAKRLARGKSLLSPLPQLPAGANPLDPDTWRIEDLVFDRVCRQLRDVGDALAWRAAGYDRRYVIALSSNVSPGLMAGKEGLPWELGATTDLRARGSFGLLHDLTNCLRIGDITEFTPDGSKLLHEIKSNPGASSGPQRRRMKAVVEAVMTGGELPGRPGQHIVTPSGRCKTHIRTFASGIDAAVERGIAGTAIAGSRALTAVSFPTLASTRAGETEQQLRDDVNAERQFAIEKARIALADGVLHHVEVASATLNHDFVPSVVPFALFPLSPIQAALLICDYIRYTVTVAPDRIARRLERLGFDVSIPLAAANDDLVAVDTVVRLRKGSRAVDLHPGALYELLIECLDLDTWAAAIAEVLEDSNAPPHPVVALSTTAVWR